MEEEYELHELLKSVNLGTKLKTLRCSGSGVGVDYEWKEIDEEGTWWRCGSVWKVGWEFGRSYLELRSHFWVLYSGPALLCRWEQYNLIGLSSVPPLMRGSDRLVICPSTEAREDFQDSLRLSLFL